MIAPTLASAVRARAAGAGFALRPSQERAVEELTRFLAAPVGGVYLYGPAGRGKTWLVDAVVAAAEPGDVVRVHLHAFLASFGPALFRHRLNAAVDAPARAIADVIGTPRVFVLDEFHTHDSGDARLLTLVLRTLYESGIGVILTSNYAPEEMLSDSPWQHTMAEAIAMIRQRYRLVQVDDGTDHRSASSAATGFASGTWRRAVSPATATASATVRSAGREFAAIAASSTLVMTFAQLCEAPTSALDFVTWSRNFASWEVRDVPMLTSVSPSAQQRFIALVDVLADADVRVTFTSPHTKADFAARAGGRPDAFRMLSRLALLGESDHFSDS